MNDVERDGQPAAEPTGGLDWAADGRYAEPDAAADDHEPRYDDRYDAPRHADPYPSHRPDPAPYDRGHEAQTANQFPSPEPRFNLARDSARDYAAPEPPHYPDAQDQLESFGRQLPAFLPRAREDRYGYDDQAQGGAGDQAYALEDYVEDTPDDRRRGGLIVVAAVLGLAVLGTAGAFAYRSMFGGSMLPSLPPIIKADDGPNKIVPNNAKANASDQADANSANSGEKLVSREEQPVDMPAPVNPAPRVVSTIPIFPDPNSAQAGMFASGGPNNPRPVASTPVTPAPVPPAPAIPAPVQNPAFAAAATAPSQPPMVSTEPRKIHTVAIRPEDLAGGNAAPAAPPATAPAPVPAPARTAQPRTATRPAPRPVPAPRTEANAPLSIVPDQGGAVAMPAPVPTRTALAQPMPLNAKAETEAAPSAAAGGYAVQVTSQRSEAEAQAEFRMLRAKFPNQLGGREPMVRRADLGAKGVYYRALVGPFASMEQAAAMCSSLKAAGGNCIVQRD